MKDKTSKVAPIDAGDDLSQYSSSFSEFTEGESPTSASKRHDLSIIIDHDQETIQGMEVYASIQNASEPSEELKIIVRAVLSMVNDDHNIGEKADSLSQYISVR